MSASLRYRPPLCSRSNVARARSRPASCHKIASRTGSARRRYDAGCRVASLERWTQFSSAPRKGEAVNEISGGGGGGAQHRGKGIISRVRLLAACLGEAPEAIELTALLKQNGEAAVGNGRSLFRWSPESLALLTAEYEKGLPTTEIAGLINERFDRDFIAEAIYTKASKLGLERPARIIVPSRP